MGSFEMTCNFSCNDFIVVSLAMVCDLLQWLVIYLAVVCFLQRLVIFRAMACGFPYNVL